MKKIILFAILAVGTVCAFALKIPTGDNIRAADVKQEGDVIVEVTVGGENLAEITTPVGKVSVKPNTKITFYKNGALKALVPIEQTVSTPSIGNIEIADGQELSFYENGVIQKVILSSNEQTIKTPIADFLCQKSNNGKSGYSSFEFYESGSPQIVNFRGSSFVTVGNNQYACLGFYNDFFPILFHDSGSSEKWLVATLVARDYTNNNGKPVESFVYENKSGKFEFALAPANRIVFYEDGSIALATLYKSPDFSIKVNGEEAYIKGGKYTYKTNWSTGTAWREISFYKDGSIQEFTLDELVMTEIDGIKFSLPVGEKILLWENGNIKRCYSSNATKVKIKTRDVDVPQNTNFLFRKNGKLWALQQDKLNFLLKSNGDGYVDTFYDDGKLKRLITFRNLYSNKSDNLYVAEFLSPISELPGQIVVSDDQIISGKGIFQSVYQLQKGDKGVNLAMLYFDNLGNPSSYTMFKLDKNGDYLLDEDGIPIEDPTRKKCIELQ